MEGNLNVVCPSKNVLSSNVALVIVPVVEKASQDIHETKLFEILQKKMQDCSCTLTQQHRDDYTHY